MHHKTKTKRYQAVVIGSSAGGIQALTAVLSPLPKDFPLPIIIVQHLHPHSNSYLARILEHHSQLRVKQADEKEPILNGWVYVAPPAYHLLIEEDRTFSLSIDQPVKFARPSVDVLFETATYAYRENLIGIILTGANNDGCDGAKRIKDMGGYMIVQDPKTAVAASMPESAIQHAEIDKVVPLYNIGEYLLQLVNQSNRILK
ncbi:chemotaxis protein CheB [Candidatus Albibeggiatoa sp. nov. NOAA]|uniref:chemotaxis protein CheB n=1 Tax=Candidatus Albibeggiatoa sp. nov. NOAA TaxID=3162724 RepID=UPI0032F70318|nr:chemotaxis protein CheB [Thiotrichaceae bacterium]